MRSTILDGRKLVWVPGTTDNFALLHALRVANASITNQQSVKSYWSIRNLQNIATMSHVGPRIEGVLYRFWLNIMNS